MAAKNRGGVFAMLRGRVKRGKSGKITLDWLNTVMKDPCPYCNEYGSDTIDHITPIIRREELTTGFGKDHYTNLVACHRQCNMVKSGSSLISTLMRTRSIKTSSHVAVVTKDLISFGEPVSDQTD